MLVTKKRLLGAVLAATVMAVGFGGGAQAAPGDGKDAKGAGRASAAAPGVAPDQATKAAVVTSSAAEKAVAGLQSRIAAYVAKNGTAYSFGSHLDATTGRIVLITDAPDTVLSKLTTTSGFAAAEAQALTSGLDVRRSSVSDRFHRRDDISPFWGGAGLLSGGGLCSAGYTVQNSAGTRFMVTAGHCYANGATVTSESGAATFGVVSGRRLPTVSGHAEDMELIGGQSYSGRTYTGGVTSTTSVPVVSAGSAVVGFADYCHSGRTTGENCGHTATSLTGQVCTGTGCKSPVTVFTGGVSPAGGDSGSPFYVKDASGSWIRGHVIAGDGTTSYAQGWPSVAAAYGVSIVTG